MKLRPMLASVTVVVALIATPATAAASSRYEVETRPPSGLTAEQTSPAQQRETLRYWTSSRMAEATPIGIERGEAQRALRALQQLLGMLTEESSMFSSPSSNSAPSSELARPREAQRPMTSHAAAGRATSGAQLNGGGAIASIGLVYFTTGDEDMSCSGAVVKSRNRDTVVTAGHCVNDGAGDFYTNWTFVPGYTQGRAPYGQWPARQLFTTTGWSQRTDVNEDVGFATLGSRGGQHVADVVGAHPISFGAPAIVDVHSFGYPGAIGRFDGESLYYCAGRTRPDEIDRDSTDTGLDCDMAEGSSGGPWLANFDGRTGTVVSVNSFAYERALGVMMGPRLDSSIKRVYDAAEAS